ARDMGERLAFRTLSIVLAVPIIYLLSALVVLDFSATAWDLCQEYDDERRQVTHGPQPRILLCRPRLFDIPGGASWSGTEWAFTVYRPLCSVWLRVKGYGRAHRRTA